MSAAEPGLTADPANPQAPGPSKPAQLSVDAPRSGPKQELSSRRERLTEQFALMQSELGGLFYEMAIRDHLQLGLLVERAAALQRVEEELRQVEDELGRA